MVELENLIRNFEGDKNSSLYKKISTKTAYCYEGINRMVAILSAKLKTISKSSKRAHNSLLDFHLLHIPDECFSDNSTDSSTNCRPASHPSPLQNRVILPSQWYLKCSRDVREMSLGSLLEPVDEISIARDVSRLQLLASAID